MDHFDCSVAVDEFSEKPDVTVVDKWENYIKLGHLKNQAAEKDEEKAD